MLPDDNRKQRGGHKREIVTLFKYEDIIPNNNVQSSDSYNVIPIFCALHRELN